MIPYFRTRLPLALLVLFWSPTAAAHIRMDAPVARNVWAQGPFMDPIKEGPCGRGANDPRSTDPAKINTFAPGETITVSWHETIDHPAHYRISIDMDGQDAFKDPSGPTDIVEPPVLPVLKDGIADEEMGTYSVEVTLPNETCDNCTLQLIQFMLDDLSDPMYYVCADLVIEGELVGGDGDGSGGTPSSGGAMGVGGTPDTGAGGAPANAGGSEAVGTGGDIINTSGGAAPVSSGGSVGTPDGGEVPSEEAGCSVSQHVGARSSLAWLASGLALLASAWVRRRVNG